MADAQASGAITNVPLLDLSHSTSPDDLAHISLIEEVATVVVPENLMSTLQRIPMRGVASVIPVAKGAHARIHTGSLMIGGDGLAKPGGETEALVVTGGLIVTSPVERVGFQQIFVTGLVLVPRGSESVMGAGLTQVTGSVVYYDTADGQDFRQFNGQVMIGGESLTNPGGSPADILLANGQLIVTGPIPETGVGYQRVIVSGGLVAPRESEPVLTPALTVNGETAWYAGSPRFLIGDETYDRTFFEALDQRQPLAFVGSPAIADDVTAEILRETVTEITLVGDLAAPQKLVGVLQALTTEKHGTITASDHDRDRP